MSCLELAPSKPCGPFGDCEDVVINSTTTVQQCVCNSPHWKQTGEMTLLFLTPEEFAAGLGPCNSNKRLLLALYWLALLLAVLGIVLQTATIRRMKQFKRLLPLYAAMSFTGAASLYRICRFEEALIGHDVAMTFFFSGVGLFVAVTMVVFSERYLLFLTKKIPFSDPRVTATLERLRKLNRYLIVADVVLFQLIWLALFAKDQTTTGQRLFRAGIFLNGLRALSFLVIVIPIMTYFIREMEKFAQSMAGDTTDLKRKVEQVLLPRTRRLRRISASLSAAIGILWVLSAAWPFALLQMTYIGPIIFVTWPMTNFAAIHANSRVKETTGTTTLQKTKSRNMSKDNGSRNDESKIGSHFDPNGSVVSALRPKNNMIRTALGGAPLANRPSVSSANSEKPEGLAGSKGSSMELDINSL